MQWLAAICVRRPVFATVIVLLLTVVGAFSYGQLGLDRFPKKFENHTLGFSKAEISRGDWIFDDDERFALLLLVGKFEFRSKVHQKTTRPCDLHGRRVH